MTRVVDLYWLALERCGANGMSAEEFVADLRAMGCVVTPEGLVDGLGELDEVLTPEEREQWLRLPS